MKVEIREVVTVDGQQMVRLTSPDQRWYARVVNRASGEPVYDYVPSVSWICSHYFKGEGLLRWVAKHGYDEAAEIKELAGDRGSKVHQAINRLVTGGTVLMDDSFENSSAEPEPLTPQEYFCLMTFVEWFEKTRPAVLRTEYTVYHEKHRYAGTVDMLVEIDGQPWLIDVKTSSQVWPSMEIQVAAYKHADKTLPKGVKLAILQVGYKYNRKQKYKFTEVPDRYPLFLATRRIWAKEAQSATPFQRDYPLSLSLAGMLPKKEAA